MNIHSDRRFMLFGSRSKCMHTLESDWDYSAQHSLEIEAELQAAGYKPATSTYTDNLTVSIFSKLEPTKIHVVLHSDEQLFRRTWDSISRDEYAKFVCKRSDRYRGYSDRKIRQAIMEYMNNAYEKNK